MNIKPLPRFFALLAVVFLGGCGFFRDEETIDVKAPPVDHHQVLYDAQFDNPTAGYGTHADDGALVIGGSSVQKAGPSGGVLYSGESSVEIFPIGGRLPIYQPPQAVAPQAASSSDVEITPIDSANVPAPAVNSVSVKSPEVMKGDVQEIIQEHSENAREPISIMEEKAADAAQKQQEIEPKMQAVLDQAKSLGDGAETKAQAVADHAGQEVKDNASNAKDAIISDTPQVSLIGEDEVKVHPSQNSGDTNDNLSVFFEHNSTKLSDDAAMMLKAFAERYPKKNGDMLSIEGHSSAQSSLSTDAARKAANLKVGAERAISVARALIEYGVPGNQVRIVSWADNGAVREIKGMDVEEAARRVEVMEMSAQ